MTNIDPTAGQDAPGDDTERGGTIAPTPHGEQGHVLDGPDLDDHPRLEEDEPLDDDEDELAQDDLAGDDAPA